MTPHHMRLADFWLPTLELARNGFRHEPAFDAGELGRAVVASLDAAVARAAEHGYPQEQIQSALFAVVAWIDEAAMTQPWPGAAAWRLAPLQRHYFSTTRAGVEFFQRLDALPEDATAVREVYGLMLVAGFAGHYGARPPGELAAVRRAVLQRIEEDGRMAALAIGQPLFPAAVPGGHATGRHAVQRRPATAALLIVLLPLAALIGLYIFFDTTLARFAAEVMRSI